MLVIRLPQEVEARLEKLALNTGRTKNYYVRKAICEYLDDLEDYYLAEARSRNKVKAIPLDEVERHLGLAD